MYLFMKVIVIPSSLIEVVKSHFFIELILPLTKITYRAKLFFLTLIFFATQGVQHSLCL